MSSPFFDPEDHLEAHERRLPHWQQGEAWQFVTWRLADSLPAEKLQTLRSERAQWLASNPVPWNEAVESEFHRLFSAQIEKCLDLGHGSCLLRHSPNARVLEGALRYFDSKRYWLGPFVIMPNHVHVLFQPIHP